MAQNIIKNKLIENSSELGRDFVYEIAGEKYDAAKLYEEFLSITSSENLDWHKVTQFNLQVRGTSVAAGMSNRELFSDFAGSLAPHKNGGTRLTESEFDTIHPILSGTYTEQVINDIKSKYSGIGRIRWLMLQPKTCYSMHKDPDWYRLHIPIKTNTSCFFIVDEAYFQTQEEGKLYVIHPQWPHTAANSNLYTERLHIVFDTAEDVQLY